MHIKLPEHISVLSGVHSQIDTKQVPSNPNDRRRICFKTPTSQLQWKKRGSQNLQEDGPTLRLPKHLHGSKYQDEKQTLSKEGFALHPVCG